MKYTIAYKAVSEIVASYCVEALPTDNGLAYECIIFEGDNCCAQFVKMDVPNLLLGQQPLLQRTTRCYIINTNDIPCELEISEILDRYG